MMQGLRLKGGGLINPAEIDSAQVIEHCAAGALFVDVPDGTFAHVENAVPEDTDADEDEAPAKKAPAKKGAK